MPKPQGPIIRPTPFAEAVKKLGRKTIVGSVLNSRQWSDMPAAIRERAFFSATVESANFLSTAKSAITDFLESAREPDPKNPGETMLKAGGRERFVTIMRETLSAQGMPMAEPGSDDVTDQTSAGRLRLIFETQTRMAQDYAYHRAGNDDEAVRRAFPAQRFIREAGTESPRPLHADNEGAERMKHDTEFWLRMNSREIGGFGVPYGPWGFNSGMGVEDMTRREAIASGLMKADDPTPPPVPHYEFNDAVRASAKAIDGDVLAVAEDALKREGIKADRVGDFLELKSDVAKPADKKE